MTLLDDESSPAESSAGEIAISIIAMKNGMMRIFFIVENSRVGFKNLTANVGHLFEMLGIKKYGKSSVFHF